MFGIIIAIGALVAYTYYRWDAISPKLVVREASTIAGTVVGFTPEVVKTTVKVSKAMNASGELALREAGDEGPVGFKTGVVMSKKYTRDMLSDINKSADKSFADSTARMREILGDSNTTEDQPVTESATQV